MGCCTVDGAVAFVFAVDAADDPAVMAITDLMTQQHQQGWTTSCLSNHAGDQQQQHGVVKSVANALCISTLAKQLKHCPHWGSSILAAWHQVPQSGSVEPRLVLLVQAGKATTCSQKIHKWVHCCAVGASVLRHSQNAKTVLGSVGPNHSAVA